MKEKRIYESLVGKPKEKIPLEITGWEGNIKWFLNKIVCVLDSLTPIKDQLRTLLKKIMNFWLQ
jgi:hypothetical protein